MGPIELTSPSLWKEKEYGGAKPLKNDLHITHHGRSEAVTRALTDFGSEESFGQAAKWFQEHDKYPLHATTVGRVTKQIAEEAYAYVEQTFAHADDAIETAPKEVEQVLVEVDGCEIRTAILVPGESAHERTPVRQAPKQQKAINWREVRIGLARPLKSLSALYVGKNASYPDVVSDLVHAAVLQGMSSTTRVIGVGDGGIGLKEELERQFPTIQFILDRPHLKNHLYETAEALGLGQHERAEWVTSRLDAIERGKVGTVTRELETLYAKTPHDRIKRMIGYLTRFADAVDYDHFMKHGYPIGSGEVESAHKTIPQKRLKLPGACWHPDSINPMAALRIIRANEWWEDFWQGQIEEKLAA